MNLRTMSKVAVFCTFFTSTLACTHAKNAHSELPQMMSSDSGSLPHKSVVDVAQLKIATWNVAHLAYPADTGCKPRTPQQIDQMRNYVERVDADIFALQEVASEQAVRLLFPPNQWQIFMSTRADSEPYTCRESGRSSTQQKVAYAVKHGVDVNSISALPALGMNIPGLRYGLELTVETSLGPMSLLNVHLKSGCFVDNYSRSDTEACKVFAQQAPLLDAWIERKEQTKEKYIVLGDFNHRLSAPYNHLTQALFSNSDGSKSTLVNTTADLIGCHPWYPAPIDLIFAGGMSDNTMTFSTDAHDFDDMQPEKMLSDHCAVTLTIQRAPFPLSSAVRWQTSSKEYQFLTMAIYQHAISSLHQLPLPQDDWIVVMDVDETILDNSAYQVMLDNSGASFSPSTWNGWVKQGKAELVPGAHFFIQAVIELGGKVAFVTNRDKALDAYTWDNLLRAGLPLSIDNACLIGRETQDKALIDGTTIINDKDLRRHQLRSGTADCYLSDATRLPSHWTSPHEIVMEVGDNIQDFTGVTQLDADVEQLVSQIPSRYILLPNPMYGSW